MKLYMRNPAQRNLLFVKKCPIFCIINTKACRGLDQNAAEDLFIRAKLEDAALSATDERTRAAVVRLGNNLIDNFEEELA